MAPGSDIRPGHVLFAVNSSGRILWLDSESSASIWKELPYLGVEFKRVSAAKNSLWAIGGDHQVYVSVFGVEIPIRIKEELYENQRWNPVDGFSNHLLPTDRPQFSSKDGLQGKSKDCKLPTMAWQWESMWYIDTIFRGTTLDKDGWTYAVDFPSDYHPKKGFTSCVRRRKWIRYRKYVAVDSWSVVPSVHKDPTEEPFLDIAVGGQELPNGDPDELLVWAVTVVGRVFFRQSVSTNNPEGSGWLHIPTPERSEVSQLSVGPSGLLWATTWHGRALVRTGVTRLEPCGVNWVIVDAPGPQSSLSHVTVGDNVVWAQSRDHKVWFRNGIRGSAAGDNESLAKGSKWVEMVGNMHMLSMGPRDQVIGILDEDRKTVVVRTGVTVSDPSGKTWKSLTVQGSGITPAMSIPRSSRAASESVSSEPSSFVSVTEPANLPSVEQGSSNANFKKKAAEFGNKAAKQIATNAAVAVAHATVGKIPIVGYPLTAAARDLVQGEMENVKVFDENLPEKPVDESMYQSAIESHDQPQKSLERMPSGDFGVVDREDLYGDEDEGEECVQWVWLTAGSCCLDPNQLPNHWFADSSANQSQLSLAGEPWRVQALQSLIANNQALEKFSDYEPAVERRSWVKKGNCRVNFGHGGPGNKWENCVLELEQTGSQSGEVDFGTLSIFGSKRNKEHLSLADVTCVTRYAEKTLAIFTSSRSQTFCDSDSAKIQRRHRNGRLASSSFVR